CPTNACAPSPLALDGLTCTCRHTPSYSPCSVGSGASPSRSPAPDPPTPQNPLVPPRFPGVGTPPGFQAPVEERDERGRKQRTTRAKDEGRGIPQGAPLSPLLANLYMRRFVLGWKQLGHEQRLDAHIVNYADDFVVCCRGSAEQALTVVRRIMQKLKW